MAPVGVSGVCVSSDDIGGVGKGVEGFAEPLFEDVIGGGGVLLVSPVDGDQGRLVVGVKGGADIYGCGGEVGRPVCEFFVEGGLDCVMDHDSSGIVCVGLMDEVSWGGLEGGAEVLE